MATTPKRPDGLPAGAQLAYYNPNGLSNWNDGEKQAALDPNGVASGAMTDAILNDYGKVEQGPQYTQAYYWKDPKSQVNYWIAPDGKVLQAYKDSSMLDAFKEIMSGPIGMALTAGMGSAIVGANAGMGGVGLGAVGQGIGTALQGLNIADALKSGNYLGALGSLGGIPGADVLPSGINDAIKIGKTGLGIYNGIKSGTPGGIFGAVSSGANALGLDNSGTNEYGINPKDFTENSFDPNATYDSYNPGDPNYRGPMPEDQQTPFDPNNPDPTAGDPNTNPNDQHLADGTKTSPGESTDPGTGTGTGGGKTPTTKPGATTKPGSTTTPTGTTDIAALLALLAGGTGGSTGAAAAATPAENSAKVDVASDLFDNPFDPGYTARKGNNMKKAAKGGLMSHPKVRRFADGGETDPNLNPDPVPVVPDPAPIEPPTPQGSDPNLPGYDISLDPNAGGGGGGATDPNTNPNDQHLGDGTKTSPGSTTTPTDTSGLPSWLTKAFTDKNGNIDWAKLLPAAGGVAGLAGLFNPSNPAGPTGYQKGIPNLLAQRSQLQYGNDPNYRPGQGGRRYFSDLTYTPGGSGITDALSVAAGGGSQYVPGTGLPAQDPNGPPAPHDATAQRPADPGAQTPTTPATPASMVGDWQNYFKTAQAGSTMDWAGGKLTYNGNGQATYTGPHGTVQLDANNPDFAAIAAQSPEIAAQWAQQYNFGGSNQNAANSSNQNAANSSGQGLDALKKIGTSAVTANSPWNLTDAAFKDVDLQGTTNPQDAWARLAYQAFNGGSKLTAADVAKLNSATGASGPVVQNQDGTYSLDMSKYTANDLAPHNLTPQQYNLYLSRIAQGQSGQGSIVQPMTSTFAGNTAAYDAAFQNMQKQITPQMQADWQNAFNSAPGTTMPWANGKITFSQEPAYLGGKKYGTYTDANGKQITFDQSMDMLHLAMAHPDIAAQWQKQYGLNFGGDMNTSGYGSSAVTAKAAQGGLMQAYAAGGAAQNPRYLQGATDGMADQIPATIDGQEPARLAHGEFVVPADVVSHLGNGNSDAGAKHLYDMMDKIRQARTGTKQQGKQIDPGKFTGGLAAVAKAKGYATGGSIPAGATGVSDSLSNWVGPYATNMLAEGSALASMPYQAYQGPLTAGASDVQNTAFSNAQNLTPPPSTFDPTTFNTGQFDTNAAQKYMNPYLQASLDPQIAEARRQSDITKMNDNAKLTQAGAYGGSRQAIMNSEADRNLGTNLANITGQGYNTAYTNAMSQFNADQGRGLQAQQLTDQSKQFGANYGLGANNAAVADVNTQLGAGAQQRAITSEGMAADQAAFNAERDNPYKMVQFQQSLLSGLPLAAQSSTIPQPSALQNVAGGATTIAQLLKNLGITA